MAVRTSRAPEVRAARAAGRDRSRRAASWRRSHALAVSSLVVLPVLVFAIPATLGHPVVPGDDLTQNLPLRVLVGEDLRHGHLPLLDSSIWSGAPLLAGWNAGAAYPLTWLFAVMPATGAWTLNLVATYSTAAVGMCCFLRASALGVVASWLGGLTFAFGGAMSAQIPHFGLVAGMSWVPLGLLATLHVTEPEPAGVDVADRAHPAAAVPRLAGWRRRLRWTAILAVSTGLVILSGEPRAIADAAVVLALYASWRLAHLTAVVGRRRRTERRGRVTAVDGAGPVAGPPGALGILPAAAGLAAGAGLGIGLGAIQLLPGLAAVATSQRAHVTASLFSSGSLPVRWLTLLGIPDLLGGSGSFGQPAFLASYSLTEVTAYVGILPVMAAFALLGRLRWRQPVPAWAIWYAVGIAGVLLALGNHMPLWHLLLHVPLFGGQRLQSRSIMVTDLALAVVLAYWLDGWLDGRGVAAARARQPDPPPATTRSREDVLATAGALAVAALSVTAVASHTDVLEWLGVSRQTAAGAGALPPWLVPYLGLALAAVALVWAGRRLGSRSKTVLVSTFVVVDLVLFALLSVAAVDAGGGAGGSAFPAARTAPVRPISSLDVQGRFAVYDPTLLDKWQLSVLGVPDANVVEGTYSVQGYGSLADGRYAGATGAHGASGTGQNVFSPRAASDGVLDELDTTTVIVPSPYLVTEAGGTGPAPGDGTGRRALSPGSTATWYLGTPTPVSSVRVGIAARSAAVAASVPERPAAPTTVANVRLGVVTPSGSTRWLATSETASPGGTALAWRATLPSAVDAVAVVATSPSALATSTATVLGAPDVTTSDGRRLVADGQLEGMMTAPHWAYAGRDGAFALYRDTRAARPLTLLTLAGRTDAGASVRRRSGPAVAPSSAIVSSPRGVGVVRAVAAIPGWTATWESPTTRTVTPLAVRRIGLVQEVAVPAGTGVLSWHYQAPELATAERLSLFSLLVVLVLALASLAARRRQPHASTRRTPFSVRR